MKEVYKNATLVDVRTPEEFKEGHYPNATNIPLDVVQQNIDKFREMPKPIIVYCRSGNRSGMAVTILKQAGINEAINGGGLDELLQSSK